MSLNGYSWVEGNVPNMGDPSGLLPCDTTSGGQDQNCLTRILRVLQTIANNGELLGIFAPGSGGTALSRIMWHYLGASGSTMYLPYDWMDPEFHKKVAASIDTAFQNSAFFQSLCSSGGCCTASGSTAIGSLISGMPVRGNRYFSISAGETPGWFSSLPGPAKEQLMQGSDLIKNVYYGVYGGITANSASASSATVVSASGSNAVIELATPIEYYDLYDWLFGGCGAGGKATGTHPEDTRVGHYMALEKAGMAKPFNWYSYADIKITYNISCGSGKPIVISKNVNTVPGTQLPNPIQPSCSTFTKWNSTNFVDNWPPNLSLQLQSKGYDDLFPTEQQMDADGNIH